jgi:hypothetical protein
LQLNQAIQEVQRKAAQIEPAQKMLPLAPGECSQLQALLREGIAEAQEHSLANPLLGAERLWLDNLMAGEDRLGCSQVSGLPGLARDKIRPL